MSQHEVVLRRTGIRVPRLGQCCRSMRKLIAVARLVGARQHRVKYIRPSAIGQRANHIMKSNIPRRYMVAVRVNVRDQVRKNSLTPVRVNQADNQRHRVRRLRTSVVLVGVGVEEARVKKASFTRKASLR